MRLANIRSTLHFIKMSRATRSSSRLAAKMVVGEIEPAKAPAKTQRNGTTANGKRKTDTESMPPPATPPPKKSKKQVVASLERGPGTRTNGTAKMHIDLADRPAEPHVTNATLLTPHGSRVVPYTNATADISPSKSGIPRATTTTSHLLDEACAHLIKIDPKFEAIIKKWPCKVFSAEGLAEEVDPFKSLVSGIMAQQVSGAAATSIKRKFIGLFNGQTDGDESQWSFPLPEVVAKAEVDFLKTAGLSKMKAEYVQGLAEKFASDELTAQLLVEAPYDELVEKLVAVRGLGKWSVEMFACFALKRMDVFSIGDLGVQRGVGVYLGRDVKKCKAKGGKWKYATQKEMEDFAEPFAPYRSLLMWYMWKLSDTSVEAVQDN